MCAVLPHATMSFTRVLHSCMTCRAYLVLCVRFLEAAYWSLEHDGKRVSDFVADSIAWRESVGAHRLKKEDVAAEGAKGTILVKGHDLQRCALTCVVVLSPAPCTTVQYPTPYLADLRVSCTVLYVFDSPSEESKSTKETPGQDRR